MERKLFNKSGVILILLIVAAAAGFLIYQNSKPQNDLSAVVNVDGEEVLNIKLEDIDAAQEYTLENGIIIKAENGFVCVEYSNCKDKICINCGNLKKNGDTAVCVPNKTVVTIVGGEKSDVDILTY